MSIITAETLMFDRSTVCQFKKDGPKGAIRKMREVGIDVLPVVDEHQVFMGFVWLKDVLKEEQKGSASVESIIWRDVPSVYGEATVEEMMPLTTNTKSPIAVIDKITGKLRGVVTQVSLIIEATKFNKREITELKQQAIEQ